jgi:hypothetical protein
MATNTTTDASGRASLVSLHQHRDGDARTGGESEVD